jgi:two-component system sensor histidine kinase KdpD
MARGRLRIYLGAAPGVGKTFAMLGEANRRAARGTDVVVGWAETHGRPRTQEQIGDLEVIPPRTITYRDRTFLEMDLDAILARRPQVVLVDELAHTNVPGSRHPKRYQDVDDILDAGIDVISTLNVQHLESVNDVVESITGVRQHETIPDEVVRSAEQIELVDMTAEALRRRMAHGNIYPPERIDAALANYFRPGNLDALRELALLWVADRVDDALDEYRRQHGIERTWETRERVLVALTGAPSGERLIRRAARMAQRGHGDLLGVHIRATDGRRDAPDEHLESHRRLLEALGGTYHEIVADDLVAALGDFARRQNATQLVLGASRRSRWAELTRGSVINAVVRASGTVDVHVISHNQPEQDEDLAASRPSRRRRPWPHHGLNPRRRAAGWVLAVTGPIALTALLTDTRAVFDEGSRYILYLVAVLAAALVGGAAPALLAAVGGALLLDWYFIEPLHQLAAPDPDGGMALVLFGAVGVAFGLFVTAVTRRATQAQRANLEAEALARTAAGLVGAEDPIPSMLERIRSSIALAGIALRRLDDGARIAAAGEVQGRGDGSISLGDAELVLYGTVRAEDRHLLELFGAQLTSALERRRLQEEAAAAAGLAETDALRTAILRAVSHDLRTPLASIKASVTSLLEGDVDWSPQDRQEFLAAIEVAADRLNHVIGDLLDASRLEAGAITPDLRPTALEEVIAAALAELDAPDASVDVDVDPALPLVYADSGLLGRALSNIVANALTHSPEQHPPTVTAQATGNGQVELRIIDHGPGVPAADLDLVFQPFQRLGDTDNRPGVGLGLHIAKGFVDAMRGTIALEETAGGGLTAVIRLPSVDEQT